VRILLDECLPVDFRHSFSGHEAHTVEWAGQQAAERGGYQLLLTVDQGIPRQQTMIGRKLSIILIRSRTNQMEDLLPLAAAIRKALEFIEPGQTVLIPFSD
jgi:predicted nuclease of predicted toxin-antitoxin system